MSRNRLAEETSPYLLQHADNPVHWYGWGPDALAAAAAADKPILLSVGYAACHWCHVMAHECFENEAIAGLMNDLFVNVKVDREERPDIDTIYMNALHLLGQQGGWPLTMFLTPDGRPFYGGTYFPPEPRYGRPSFPQVLSAIADYWTEKRDKALETAAALEDGLRTGWTPATPAARGNSHTGLPLAVNDQAAARLAQEFDMEEGGIGSAPKFPNPSIQELVWRGWLRSGSERQRDAVLLSLAKMSQGGIYDHLGGGFARYSTDSRWLVPHFEKMLYDNAQLIDLLTWAWQATHAPLFAQRVEETVEWALREMIAPVEEATGDAAFAATYDADSEGEEGRFYVWSAQEISEILGDGADAVLFRTVYDVSEHGNWEGHTILNRSAHPEHLDPEQEKSLAACRAKLLVERAKRIWPGWDDKVLADWNGLMIAALAQASRVFERPHWLDAAERAFRFVRDRMQPGGRLRHSFRKGRARHAATLDDYACMIRAALALHEATGGATYLDTAMAWVDAVDTHYADPRSGAYFFTADDAEALIVRTRTAADNATPSGNGTLCAALARLYYLTGEDRYRKSAEAIVTAFSGEVESNFFPLTALLCANEILQRGTQVVIAGDPADPATTALVRAAWAAPNLNRIIQQVGPDADLPEGHPAHGKGPVGGRPAAYVCVGQSCSLPLTEPQALAEALKPEAA